MNLVSSTEMKNTHFVEKISFLVERRKIGCFCIIIFSLAKHPYILYFSSNFGNFWYFAGLIVFDILQSLRWKDLHQIASNYFFQKDIALFK